MPSHYAEAHSLSRDEHFFASWRTLAAVESSTVGSAAHQVKSGPGCLSVRAPSEGFQMLPPAKCLLLASLLLGVLVTSANGAEREDVRKVINLVTSVKMPYPENLPRNRAKTERVWLEREGAMTGCIKLEDRRWCYEHIPPIGNRAEMLRIRNEPSRGIYIDALYYYIVDYDLDGLIDVGSTTRIEAVDRQNRTPIAHVIEFFSRSTKRGDQFQANFQKMYDEGIQIALKYFGE